MVYTSSPDYLYRRNGIYYFTRNVPSDLKSRFNKERVVVSLHTRSVARAKKSAMALSDRLERYFESLRMERFHSQELGVQYGMSAYGMGKKASLHVLEAEDLIQRHKDVYHIFWKWAEQNVNAGLAGVELHTVFGWKIRAGKGRDVKENTFLNWPMQANGAEMLRLACIAMEEEGIGICAPVHDAILIEAPLNEIDQHVASATHHMQKASGWVLGRGRHCRVDAEIVR